jgi:hypothetical protein
MCYKDNALELQLSDHVFQLQRLVCGGVRITDRLVGSTPPKKIKSDYASWWREVGNKTVIEVHIIGKAMHKDNRRFLTRVLSCVNPVLIQLYKFLFVVHHFTKKGCHISISSAAPFRGAGCSVLLGDDSGHRGPIYCLVLGCTFAGDSRMSDWKGWVFARPRLMNASAR